MVALRDWRECDCKTCKGRGGKPGVYGGWVCQCLCHRLKETVEIQDVKRLFKMLNKLKKDE